MRAPTTQEKDLLRLFAGEPSGRMDHDDPRLEPFCSDASTLTNPDVFNACHDLGWLKTWRDGHMDSSAAEITEAGRQCLAQP
jgi:hypothetical protein